MNYLQILNRTLEETGLDAAPLSQANFASPPDRMYTRLKNWVAEANREMQKERPETQTLVKEGVAMVSPRFTFYDYNDIVPTTLPQGAAESTETERVFSTAPAIFTTAEEGYSDIVQVNSGAVSVDNPVNFALRLGEVINYPADDPAAIVRFKRWGTYNLTDQNNAMDTLLTDVGLVYLTEMSYVVDSTTNPGTRKICYVPFTSSEFPEYGCWYATAGEPRIFTKMPDGRFAFYPHPAYPIRVRFTYSEKMNELVNYDDVPTWLDEKWHEGIAYLAASYFGDYENPKVAQRCFRRYYNTKIQMERELMPTPTFQPICMWR